MPWRYLQIWKITTCNYKKETVKHSFIMITISLLITVFVVSWQDGRIYYREGTKTFIILIVRVRIASEVDDPTSDQWSHLTPMNGVEMNRRRVPCTCPAPYLYLVPAADIRECVYLFCCTGLCNLGSLASGQTDF